jgi:aerobic-type carbon monoxide dehydrogenase small subunit (CoxS/CutS family)
VPDVLVEMTVNGRLRRVDVQPDETLLSVLRDRLQLRGSKDGCSEGECGACTVLLDGQPIDSCIYPAAAAAGREVRTVEGLAPSAGELSPLQQAFIDSGAVQCGFCTPGFLMTLTALLAENPNPTPAQVREAISGNICRCTGYQDIVRAVSRIAGGAR